MGIGYFLQHRVAIIRATAVVDVMDQPELDEMGQPIVESVVVGDETVSEYVPASIQPVTGQRADREVALVSQSGAALSDTTIYLLPIEISTADAIHHDPDFCPVLVNDLPDAHYQIVGVPQAAGAGHHLEVRAKLVGSPASAIAPVPAAVGSGS